MVNDPNKTIKNVLDQVMPYESSLHKLLNQQSILEKIVNENKLGSPYEALHKLSPIIDQQNLASKSLATIAGGDLLGQSARELTIAHDRLTDLTKVHSNFANLYDFSEKGKLGSIIKALSNEIHLPHQLTVFENWPKVLQTQMFMVKSPWLDLDCPSLSFEGFATVSRLTQTVLNSHIYDGWAREIIDEDLGAPIIIDDDAGPEERDKTHVDAGMNESMLAIAPSAVDEVLVQTGFVLKAEYLPIPETQSDDAYGLAFNPAHNMIITVVEQNLRHTIEKRMTDEYGHDWMSKRVNSKLIQEWSKTREQAVKDGEPKLSLIHYSNFMELKDIVVGREHWRVLFSTIFKEKNHFQVAMERLHPIRNPLSHSRPIGVAAQYHLISEAAHLLKALGIDIFKK